MGYSALHYSHGMSKTRLVPPFPSLLMEYNNTFGSGEKDWLSLKCHPSWYIYATLIETEYLLFCILAECRSEFLVILHHSCLSEEEEVISEHITTSFELMSTSANLESDGSAMITRINQYEEIIKLNASMY